MLTPPSNHLKPPQLRLIAAIADTGQISLAARSVAVSQPAASRSLSEIEALLGTKLFHRTAKGMEPTLAGQAVARRARDILVQYQDLGREVAELRAGTTGMARVGAVTGAALAHVVPAIAQIKATSPSAEIVVQVAPSDKLVADFVEGDLDFILARLPDELRADAVEVHAARTERLALMVRADHPLAGASAVTLAELRHYPWVMQSRGSPIRSAVDAAFHAAKVPLPRDVTETASLLVMISMMTTTATISVAASEVAELLSGEGLRGRIVTLPVTTDVSMPPYLLIVSKQRRLSPLANRLLKVVTEGMLRA